MKTEEYFDLLEKQTNIEYSLASQARKNGCDPSEEPEIYLAKDLAEKVEGLIELKGLADIIRKVSSETESEVARAFKIAEQVAKNESDKEKAADKAIRAGLAYLTQGAVAAPLEGIAKVKLHKNSDSSEYISIYFAGPIRAAGGTAEALCVIVADYVRKVLGLEKYQPTSQEISRYFEEIQWYNRRTHLQYMPSEEEVKIIIKNTPICVDGEPTERYEVANFRDLGRVETNRVRGGMCLVVSEGLAQKAAKLWKRMKPIQKEFDLDWTWLTELLEKKHPKTESEKSGESYTLETSEEDQEDQGGNKKYLREVPAGRPVFSHYARQGGFRLRYGRTRASGYAAAGMNPATMYTLGKFVAIGTQIRLEMPGKAAIITPCNTVEGPLVKLKSGEVRRLSTMEESIEVEKEVESILQLGDLLISAGDFLENNQKLAKPAFCEEWWALLLEAKSPEEAKPFLENILTKVSFEKAVELSKKYEIPLHPKHTLYWSGCLKKNIQKVIELLSVDTTKIKNDPDIKTTIENLGVCHKVENNTITINEEHHKALLFCLGFPETSREEIQKQISDSQNLLCGVNKLCSIQIKNRAPTYIGARMGRPEKAKPRKTTPPFNTIFPTGAKKGRIRDIVKIANTTRVGVTEIAKYKCTTCGTFSIYPKCSTCGSRTELTTTCPRCSRPIPAEQCPVCGVSTISFEKKSVNFKETLDAALKNLNLSSPEKIKGILGMASKTKTPEALEKGILRAKYNLFVFKDGTIRFDSTDAPLTHFTPNEVGSPINKLKKLGYTEDYKGEPLERGDQLLPLKSQDILLSDHGDDSAAKCFINTTKFIDDLLLSHYKLKPYYKVKKKIDLIGKMIIGLAPHTSTGTVGRIVGFTKARVGYAHPAFHDAKRRDCDGDEDAVLLLLDAFLNFSRAFLPEKRGGKMDAPLVVTTRLTPTELDDEIYDIDIVPNYGIPFYEAAEINTDPGKVGLKTVESILEDDEALLNWPFTHHTADINDGPIVNTYSTGEMLEKLNKQLDLAEKSRAVDERDVAEKILSSHFLPDIKGNLRTFSKQKVRCTKCNTKYRRPPLSCVCSNCGNKLTMTVHEGSIKKYLEISKQMIKKYNIDPYLAQQITMFSKALDSIFGIDPQKKLGAF
jgi:DNA polymerase II large subunit